ncbi:MAG: hypothetical protein ACQEQO_08450 [Thermodesulfobacteriota bacterium]
MIKNSKNNMEEKARNPYFFNTVGVFLYIGIFLSLLFMAISIFDKNSLAQEKTDVIADERIVAGTGKIVNANIALARNEAISQAFLKAVEEYLFQTLGRQDIADNFQQLDEEILSQTKEEIQDYQIISEFTTDKYVKILMKVRVDKAMLEKKLQNMKIREVDAVQISVLFLVSEKKEDLSAIYWWGDPTNQTSLTQTELYLSKVFEDKGFRVINRSFFPPEESHDESMYHLTLTNEAAVKWGKLLSAQIVITGQANLYETSKPSIFFKALKVADGTVIAASYREGMLNSDIAHEQNAMELTINNWANDMIPRIIEAAKPTQTDVNQIFVTIKGIRGYGEFLHFKEFLRNNVPEIQSVLERRLKRDSVKVSVKVKEDSKGLAEKLLNHPKKPFSFEINDVSDQGFTLVIR